MRMKNGSSPGNLKLLIAQRLLGLGWVDRGKKFSACEWRKLFFSLKTRALSHRNVPIAHVSWENRYYEARRMFCSADGPA